MITIKFIIALCSLPFVCSFSEVPLLGGFFIERSLPVEQVYECVWVAPNMSYNVQQGRCFPLR